MAQIGTMPYGIKALRASAVVQTPDVGHAKQTFILNF